MARSLPFHRQQNGNPLAPGKITDLMDLISSSQEGDEGQLGEADLFDERRLSYMFVT